MTIRRAMAGASLAALLVLAACSSDDDTGADDAPATEDEVATEPADPGENGATDEDEEATDDAAESADDETDDVDAAADCPPLSEGDTVQVGALAQCSQDALQDTAGYAAQTEVMGMVSVLRVNNDPQALHMDSDLGEVIAIEGQTWVNADGQWQEGDPDSADPMVAALSSVAEEAATQADPAAQLQQMGQVDLTVTDTDTRLGQEVYVISGSGAGIDDLTYYVNADYAVLAADVQVNVEGIEIATTLEITEWDTAQEINAPM